MRKFGFKRDSWPSFRNQLLLRSTLICVLAAGTGLFIAGGDSLDGTVLVISIALAAGALSVGLFRGLQRQHQAWESFEIELRDDLIIRRQANTAEVRIRRDEVSQISEAPGKSIAVRGPNRFQIIAATPRIESYRELVDSLRKWNVPYRSKPANNMPVVLASVVATLGLMVVAFSVDGMAGAGSAILLIALLVWCHREIRLSPHLDRKTKKGAWMIWLVIISLGFRALHALGYLHAALK